MNSLPDPQQAALELLKVEYEKAADRYNNIYQSIWTIFSYMSAVSAAFLAFGAERITPWALGFFAPLPLLFWFWSTYMPLDKYGNKTLVVLKRVEKRANADFGASLGHFSAFAKGNYGLWSDFECRRRNAGFRKAVQKVASRARFAIVVSFLLLHLFFVWAVYNWWQAGFALSTGRGDVSSYHLEMDAPGLLHGDEQPRPHYVGPVHPSGTPR